MLQSLTSIHLYSDLTDEPEVNGNGDFVYFLLVIAFFIVVIAWVNYINLSTARALERAGEVGIRKVMGALKIQLVKQFLMESLLINFFAMVISIAFLLLALQFFNQLTGMNLDQAFWARSWFWVAVICLFLFGSFFSGLYPSFVLSSFRPSTILKGKYRNSSSGNLLRKTLVVIQFSASIFLIAGTVIVYRQLQFMQNQDLGYNMDQVMVIQRPGVMERDRQAIESSIDFFKNELMASPNISNVAGSFILPGKKLRFKSEVKRYASSDDSQVAIAIGGMDFDFIDMFGMDLVAGRKFSKEYGSDQDTSVMLTKSGTVLLGYESPEAAIGQTIEIPLFQWKPIIVGVLDDYHQESLKLKTLPTLFFVREYMHEYYMVKVSTSNLRATIDHAQKSWNKAFPGNPFDYFFLDDYFNAQYRNEAQFGNLFMVFSILAIIVGCLGLFGLSAFVAQQRTKEIGVRKVLGSSVKQIVVLLNRDFVKLVAISSLIAWPVIWIVMNKWLDGFAYKTQVSLLILLIASISVILIALITVSFQTIKAAVVNPAHSLRYE